MCVFGFADENEKGERERERERERESKSSLKGTIPTLIEYIKLNEGWQNRVDWVSILSTQAGLPDWANFLPMSGCLPLAVT
jgi:hypothetical protein